MCDILIKALQDGGGLNAKAHKAVVKAAGNEAHTARLKEEQVNLDGMKGSGGRKVAKHLERMGKTGAWLSVIPSCFDGTELSREEFQDNLTICYGLRPRGLPECCNDFFLEKSPVQPLSQLSTGSAVRGQLCGTAA